MILRVSWGNGRAPSWAKHQRNLNVPGVTQHCTTRPARYTRFGYGDLQTLHRRCLKMEAQKSGALKKALRNIVVYNGWWLRLATVVDDFGRGDMVEDWFFGMNYVALHSAMFPHNYNEYRLSPIWYHMVSSSLILPLFWVSQSFSILRHTTIQDPRRHWMQLWTMPPPGHRRGSGVVQPLAKLCGMVCWKFNQQSFGFEKRNPKIKNGNQSSWHDWSMPK